MKKMIIVLTVFGLLVAAGCSESMGSSSDAARKNDEQVSADALEQFQRNQPTPKFDYSQLRQNLIELTTAQAQSTATTTFFFLEGVDHPIDQCPSIGGAIPTTMQLTNPDQMEQAGHGNQPYTLPQAEVTGVYTGDSTGTYVMCLDAQGNAYANYWEGYIKTVFGPAEWDAEAGQVKLVGPPSFDFSEGQ